MEELGEAPCIRVCDVHVFHGMCIKDYLERGWTTLNITFAFLGCPACKKDMNIPVKMPVLGSLFAKQMVKKNEITKFADSEARIAGLKASSRLKDPIDPYFNNWTEFALASCTFYECDVCKSPYFGGMNDCRQAMLEERSTLKQHLRCKECLSKELGFGNASCDKKEHGDLYIDYKCRFCCNVATFVCYNLTHFCNECHTKATRQAI